ncbi:cytochrome P450 [Nonomuraea sp. NPDC050790]|uniref:cytochrome P450 n=1 Tax=Nonomuraea sp. NPDC050790 TaxID=3364371 RepID=UPI0037BC890B
MRFPETFTNRPELPMTRVTSHDGHPGWLVTRHATVRQVLTDPRFSARQELKRPMFVPVRLSGARRPAAPGWFSGMDAPEHTRYRRHLHTWFTARNLKKLEPRVTAIARELVDGMDDPADLVRDYALPIPSRVICEILGVPYADHEFFETQTTRILDRDPEVAHAAVAALLAYMRELVEAGPEGGVLAELIANGSGLGPEELANIGLGLLTAGHETTAHMISLGVLALLEHPDQLAALAADEGLMGSAVEELLRYLSILHLAAPSRAALEDVELDGVRVRAGETVTLSLPAANRDPEVFADPDRLDLSRAEAGENLAFGHGAHLCLGHNLARMEMAVAYRELFARRPGLRLAVPAHEVELRADTIVFGAISLPVTWG